MFVALFLEGFDAPRKILPSHRHPFIYTRRLPTVFLPKCSGVRARRKKTVIMSSAVLLADDRTVTMSRLEVMKPPQHRCLATTTSARQRRDSETQALLQKERLHDDPKEHLNQRVPLNFPIILNTDILEHKLKKTSWLQPSCFGVNTDCRLILILILTKASATVAPGQEEASFCPVTTGTKETGTV